MPDQIQIVLDMDGVLADFTAGAAKAHRREIPDTIQWDFFKSWGITEDEFWHVIHEFGDSFYRTFVPKYPWADYLIKCLQKFADDNIVVMTSPSNHPSGYSGKKVWLERNFPGVFKPDQLIVGSRKHLLADWTSILIDDNEGNVRAFKDAGGHAILFPQPWNSLGEIIRDDAKVQYVGRILAELMGAR